MILSILDEKFNFFILKIIFLELLSLKVYNNQYIFLRLIQTRRFKKIYIHISYEHIKYIKTIKSTTKNHFTTHILITQLCQVILHFGVIISQLIKLTAYFWQETRHIIHVYTVRRGRHTKNTKIYYDQITAALCFSRYHETVIKFIMTFQQSLKWVSVLVVKNLKKKE